MMNPIFVDTSALIALGSQMDGFHQQAKILRKELVQAKRKFVTTHAVILEIGSYFSQTDFRRIAVQLIEDIQQAGSWECLPSDPWMEKAIVLFKERPDKGWSLVDCISILVANDKGITEIFTNDHHFEQAGFHILLSP